MVFLSKLSWAATAFTGVVVLVFDLSGAVYYIFLIWRNIKRENVSSVRKIALWIDGRDGSVGG